MQLLTRSFAASTLFLAASAAWAGATPCMGTLPSGSVNLTGGNDCQLVAAASSIDAVFVYADADGTSTLSLPDFGDIFTNHFNNVGDTVPGIPTQSGQLLDFTLTAHSVPNVFVAGIAASDGKYHAAYRDWAHFSDYNVPPLVPGNAAYDYMAANGGLAAYTFVAWEDIAGGDYDYNDLVFAFRGVATTVPEPGETVLLGLGLLAIGLRARQRA